MSNSAFQPTVLTITSGTTGSVGQGELNLDTNPVAATDTTGYTAGTSHTVTRSTSASPLDPLVTTCLDISSTAAVVNAAAAGVYYSIASVPSSLRNKKLKLEFYVTTPASSLGTWGVSVRRSSGATRVSLTTDSSGETILPAGFTGKFTTYFDTDNTTDYTIHFYQKAHTSANTLKVTQIVVGPGIQPQGAVVGEWTSYTPTVSTGTWTNTRGYYQRVGSTLHLKIYAGPVTANGTGLYTWTLPSGLTADFNALGASGVTPSISDTDGASNTLIPAGIATVNTQGNVWYMDGLTNSNLNDARAYFASSTTIAVVGGGLAASNRANGLGSADNLLSIAGVVQIEAKIPIAEWAGSGTVQVAQNDVEYAYNTDVTSTASITTSGFAYGPTGTAFPASAWSIGTQYTRRVQFQTPIQAGDRVEVELDWAGDGRWEPMSSLFPRATQGTVNYGPLVIPVSGNNLQYDIQFSAGGVVSSNTTYGQNGTASWSGLGATTNSARWRVRKSSAGAAVGFGIHQPGVSSGLVSASGLVGRTDGLAVASGYVGEVIGTLRSGTGGLTYSTRSSNTLTTSTSNVVSVTLNKGVYLINGSVKCFLSTGTSGIVTSRLKIGGTTVSDDSVAYVSSTTAGSAVISCPVVISADSTVVSFAAEINTGTSGGNSHEMFVTRIA